VKPFLNSSSPPFFRKEAIKTWLGFVKIVEAPAPYLLLVFVPNVTSKRKRGDKHGRGSSLGT